MKLKKKGDPNGFKELSEHRKRYAMDELLKYVQPVTVDLNDRLTFEWKGSTVYFYPYTGWATGKTIEDGRGIKKLIDQLKRG